MSVDLNFFEKRLVFSLKFLVLIKIKREKTIRRREKNGLEIVIILKILLLLSASALRESYLLWGEISKADTSWTGVKHDGL